MKDLVDSGHAYVARNGDVYFLSLIHIFNYGEMRLGQGRDNAKQFLKEHPEVSDEIEKIVRANADRLLAAGKKGTVKPLDPSEIVKRVAAGEAPAAPAEMCIRDSVWGKNYFGDVKIVDVNIRRLRMKIEDEPSSPQHILTVWGYGYRWNA